MTADEIRLMELFTAFAPAERDTLLAFAEFLATRAVPLAAPRAVDSPAQSASPKQTPQNIPRPEQETVVAALKRLAATYPMLDKNKLLTDTSGLVTQHIMQRRDAAEVIDELEAIFAQHYQAWSDAAV